MCRMGGHYPSKGEGGTNHEERICDVGWRVAEMAVNEVMKGTMMAGQGRSLSESSAGTNEHASWRCPSGREVSETVVQRWAGI